jgi:crotonobetainyl-CoA:carnitine CoA-transferase CaiB-like acyl-CoA transferase
VKDDRVGELAVQGVVPKLSETPGQIKHLGAELGAHNREIYMDRFGLSEKELAALREEGVI